MTSPDASDSATLPGPAGRDDGPGRRAALLLAAAVLAVYLFTASRTTLWDRDEPRFCRAAVEMLESGNYLYPTFNGELRPDKPVGVYWLLAASISLLGQTSLACRLPSAVGIAATCLLTYYVGRRMFGRRAGLAAMAIMATGPLAMFMANFATADGVAMPLIWAAVACYVAAVTGRARWFHWVGFGAAASGAMLVKGPLGLIPLAVVGAAWIFARGRAPLGRRTVLAAVAATLLAAVPFVVWLLWADRASGGELIAQGIGRHVIGRATSPMESHGGGGAKYLLYLPYYLPVVAGGFFPWVAFSFAGVSALAGGRLGGRAGGALLAGMTLPVFVGFSLVATKLPHYVLPMWPGLAVATGATLARAAAGRLAERDAEWLARSAWTLRLGGGGAAVALAVTPWLLPMPGFRWPCAAVAAALAATCLLGARDVAAKRYPRATATLAAGMLAAYLLLAGLGGPEIERAKPIPELARRIRENHPEAPLATLGFDEPSLYFYSRRHVRDFVNEPDGAERAVAWLGASEPGLLVTTADIWRALEERMGPLPGRVVHRAELVNYAKRGRRRELLLIERAPL